MGRSLSELFFHLRFTNDDERCLPRVEDLAEVLHVRARHAVPEVTDQTTRSGPGDRTTDDGRGKEDSHDTAHAVELCDSQR